MICLIFRSLKEGSQTLFVPLRRKGVLKSLLVLTVFLFSACIKDITDLNVNPDQPLNTDPNYIFSYVLQQGTGNYNSAVSLEQWGLMNWVMYMASREGVEEGREYPMPPAKDDFWREQYTNTLSNAQIIVNMAADDPEMKNMKAAARIWQVYIFSMLTDLWGDIPYSEALSGLTELNFSPAYDRQSDIYKAMITQLQEDVNTLDTQGMFFDPQYDLIYNGNVDHWKAFGNSLMLRLATRINMVDFDYYADVVQGLHHQPLIGSQEESAIFPFNAQRKNHLWETMYRNESTIQNNPSKFFVDLLVEGNDPRVKVFFEEAPLSFLPFIPKYKGVPNLLPNSDPYWDNYNINESLGIPGEWGDISRIGQWFLNDNTPGVIMNYSEVYFLLAEAALHGLWYNNPDQLMKQGVEANIRFFNLYGTIESQISESEISIFVLNLPDATLEEIITQKYISFGFEQGYEAYAEYRRTGYPVLEKYDGSGIDKSIFPLRLPYPNSEYTLNRKNYNEAVSNQGPDNEFTPIWWIP